MNLEIKKRNNNKTNQYRYVLKNRVNKSKNNNNNNNK